MTGQYSSGMPWQQPPPYPGAPADRRSSRHKLAVTALVLGGSSLLCLCLTGIPAVVVGIIALTSSQRPLPRRFDRDDGMAAAGLTLGALMTVVLLVVAAFSSPESTSSKDDGKPDDSSSSAPATATSSPSAEPGPTETPSAVPKVKRYRVLRIVDPATVVLAYRGETTVRVIGIEVPRRKPEECFGVESLHRAHALLAGQRVELILESPPQRDDQGHLLVQLTLPRDRDFGLMMLNGGHAAIRTSARLPGDYRNAQAKAKAANAGLWNSCNRPHALVAPPEPDPEPEPRCHPSYRGACVPIGAGDLDCPDIGAPVLVVGPDEYGLDRDNDGRACEWS